MNDLRQDVAYAEYMARLEWGVESDSSEHVFAYVRRLPLLPVSVLKVQRPPSLSLAWVDEVAKKNRSIIRYVEPANREQANRLVQVGYRLHRSPFLPTKTLVADVRLPEKRLLAGMKSKTRYNISLAQRNRLQVVVRTGKELLGDETGLIKLDSLLTQNSKRLKIFGMPRKWLGAQFSVFGERCFVVMIETPLTVVRSKPADGNTELLAAAVFLMSKDTVFYEQNGSTEWGRKLMAPTLCVWEGMKIAKKRGLKQFDFDGIYDARFPRNRWKGFSRFKLGFGGKRVLYPGLYWKWL